VGSIVGSTAYVVLRRPVESGTTNQAQENWSASYYRVLEFVGSHMNVADRASLLLCTLSAFLVLISCSPQGKPSDFSESKGKTKTLQLAVQILADRNEYRMSDVLRLDTRLKNTGPEMFYIFQDMCWNPGNLLNIHVLDVLGKEVTGQAGVLRDCVPPLPAQDDTSRFTEMEPGSFEGITEKFDIRELVPRPGEYDIVVHYHSGISQDWISKYGGSKLASLPIWTSEYPEIASNRLHIVAKP
jgi:hypothetical protein